MPAIRYKKIERSPGEFANAVFYYDTAGKEHSIPLVEGNIDYQDYIKWLAAGNTPEDADNLIEEHWSR